MGAFTTMAVGLTSLGCGVMAGVYYTFSGFVMRSLAVIDRPSGIAAMQSINRVILSSSFIPIFMGTSLASLALAIWGLIRWGQRGSAALVAGGVVYLVGMFVCTAAFNVPLNDALELVDPRATEAASVWNDYLRRWTLYNHVRTIASLTSFGLFAAAAYAMR